MNPRSRSHLGASLLVAVLVLAAGNHLAAALTGSAEPPTARYPRRSNVIELPREPAALPPAPRRPSVLLIGNSHTYALPGLEPGQPLRPGAGATLIDELEAGVRAPLPSTDALFYSLSYPNFLPFEMLTRYAHLSYHGYRPRVIVLGLTWRNVARDRQPRHQIAAAFERETFGRWMLERLAAPPIAARPEVMEMVEERLRAATFAEREDLQQSAADRLDAWLTSELGEKIALIGRSAELRARIYREIAYGVGNLLIGEQQKDYTYEMVEEDLEFNLLCLRALLRWFAADGAAVIVYRAPERSDLPPLVDDHRQDEVLGEIEREAAELGFVTVDARRVVPDELWGWERNTPDRSHFTEPGHRRLAAALVAAGLDRDVWLKLSEEKDDALQ